MSRKELHSQIDSLLEKLLANNALLKVHDGKFSQLETDLLRKQCIELYDAINQLHLVNMMDKSSKPVIETAKKEEPKKEPEPVQEEIKEIEVVENNIKEFKIIVEEPKTEPVPEITETIAEEDIVTPVIEIKQQPNYDAPKFVPVLDKPVAVIEAPKTQTPAEKSVLDKINETKSNTTLHDNLASKKEESELSHRFANSKISKIKDAIDISKRFELQSNLFGGDSNAYNISLSELEVADNKESALELFNRFAGRYHWKADNELALELKSFIYRKY